MKRNADNNNVSNNVNNNSASTPAGFITRRVTTGQVEGPIFGSYNEAVAWTGMHRPGPAYIVTPCNPDGSPWRAQRPVATTTVPTTTVPEPVVFSEPEPTVPCYVTVSDTEAGQVSAVAVARIADHDKMLAQIGLVRPAANRGSMLTEAGLQVGSAAIDVAYSSLRTRRAAWEELPLVEDGLDDVVRGVEAEQREDYDVEIGVMNVNDQGFLVIEGAHEVGFKNDIVPLEVQGWKTMLPRIMVPRLDRGYKLNGAEIAHETGPGFSGAFEFLFSLPAADRAGIIRRVLRRADPSDMVKIRTRLGPDGGRQVYAATSTRYEPFNVDRVARMLQNTLRGSGLRGEVRYNAATTDLIVDASTHADATTRDFAAGDVFQVGVRFKANDASQGSVSGEPFARWNACLNLVIISTATGQGVRRAHKAGIARIENEIHGMMDGAQPTIDAFAEQWGVLRNTSLSSVRIRGERYETPHEAARAIIQTTRQSAFAAIPEEVWEDVSARGHNGDSVAAIADVLTRIAWERMLDDIQRDRAEREAGMYLPVLARAVEASR